MLYPFSFFFLMNFETATSGGFEASRPTCYDPKPIKPLHRSHGYYLIKMR